MAQLVHPVRILEKTHVNDVIGVEWEAVLETERLDGHLQGALLPRHDVADAPGQIVDTHGGRVDDLVGGAAQWREETHLGLDTVHERAGALEGMGTTVGFVAAHEGLGAGFEEDDAVDDARALELLECGVQCAEEGARANVYADRQAVHAGRGVIRHHADESGQHRRRQVVDDVPVQVLKRAGGTGSARSGVAGDDEDLIGGTRLVLDADHVAHGDTLGNRGRVLLVHRRGLGLAFIVVVRGCVVGHGVLLTGGMCW